MNNYKTTFALPCKCVRQEQGEIKGKVIENNRNLHIVQAIHIAWWEIRIILRDKTKLIREC